MTYGTKKTAIIVFPLLIKIKVDEVYSQNNVNTLEKIILKGLPKTDEG